MDATTVTLLIILAGVTVVVGGVLFFRLHAFLALILAALVVAGLTPQSTLECYEIEGASLAEIIDPAESLVDRHLLIDTGNGKPKQPLDKQPGGDGVQPGGQFLLVRRQVGGGRYHAIAVLVVKELQPSGDGKNTLAVLETAKPLNVNSAEIVSELTPANGEGVVAADAISRFDLAHVEAGDRVIDAVALKQARKQATATIGSRIASGFGSTCASIGILIALASVIGKCLLDSGAADRIVRTMLRWCGEVGAPAAFGFSGFLLGIPVFFDTVFYLMVPLGKAMRLRTGKNYLFYVLSIVCGGTMAHSLIPPTPGPLFVAEALGVNMGTMILGGGVVGMITVVFGYFYARGLNSRYELPLRETPDFTLAEIESAAAVNEADLPPFFWSLMPVLLPVLLIAGLTIIKRLAIWKSISPTGQVVLNTLGDKNIALLLAAACALATLVVHRRQSLASLSDSIQKALAGGGVIILITAAGGAFGEVLRQTGVASLMSQLTSSSPIILCSAAFFITTAIRTAQGSATVAMITAVGILGGIVSNGQLSFHPVYLALAIGCGSKPVAWMNDSGFWVITKMSGMTEQEGLKYVTPMTASMGLVGLLAVLAGVILFPTF